MLFSMAAAPVYIPPTAYESSLPTFLKLIFFSNKEKENMSRG